MAYQVAQKTACEPSPSPIFAGGGGGATDVNVSLATSTASSNVWLKVLAVIGLVGAVIAYKRRKL